MKFQHEKVVPKNLISNMKLKFRKNKKEKKLLTALAPKIHTVVLLHSVNAKCVPGIVPIHY